MFMKSYDRRGDPAPAGSARKALADLRKQANAVRRALENLRELSALERLPEGFDVTAFEAQIEILTASARRSGRPQKLLTLRERYETALRGASRPPDPRAERAALLHLWHESKARNPGKKLTQAQFVQTLVSFQWEKAQSRPLTLRQRNSKEFQAQVRHWQNELSKAKREAPAPG